MKKRVGPVFFFTFNENVGILIFRLQRNDDVDEESQQRRGGVFFWFLSLFLERNAHRNGTHTPEFVCVYRRQDRSPRRGVSPPPPPRFP